LRQNRGRLCAKIGKSDRKKGKIDQTLQTIQRILISRLRFMGDIILTTPLLHQVRHFYPQAQITYLAEKPYHTLLENNPNVDQILSFHRADNRDLAKVMFILLKETFDLAIDLFGNPRSGWLTFLSGASIRIGGDFRLRKRFYTYRIADDGKAKTAIDFHLQYLRPLGQPLLPIEPPVVIVSEDERRWAVDYLQQNGWDRRKKLIGIHPGATWPAKMWLAERFAELAKRLAADPQLQILYTAGPGESTRLQGIRDLAGVAGLTAEGLTLRQLAAVLQQAQVYIANDCGPLHLAPAVGTRVVGIFGPGEPEIWFPYAREKGHRLVYHHLDCSRCHRDRCEDLACMRAITVDQVCEAVYSALNHEVRDA